MDSPRGLADRSRPGEPTPPGRKGRARPRSAQHVGATETPLGRLRALALPLVAHLRAGRLSRGARAATARFLATTVARELPELPRAAEVAANAGAIEAFWDGLLTARAALGPGRRDANVGDDLAPLVVARCLSAAGLSARRAKAATASPARETAPDESRRHPNREAKLRQVVELVRRHADAWTQADGDGLVATRAAWLVEDLQRAFPEDFRHVTLEQARDALRRWSPGEPSSGRLSTTGVAAQLITSASHFKATEATRARLQKDIDRAVGRAGERLEGGRRGPTTGGG